MSNKQNKEQLPPFQFSLRALVIGGPIMGSMVGLAISMSRDPLGDLLSAGASGGLAVGCLLAEVAGSRLHLLWLGVVARSRGRGASRALLRAAIVWAVEADLDAIALEVHESNDPAQALYESFGFVAVQLRPRYYPDGDVAASMSVSLVDVANLPAPTRSQQAPSS